MRKKSSHKQSSSPKLPKSPRKRNNRRRKMNDIMIYIWTIWKIKPNQPETTKRSIIKQRYQPLQSKIWVLQVSLISLRQKQFFEGSRGDKKFDGEESITARTHSVLPHQHQIPISTNLLPTAHFLLPQNLQRVLRWLQRLILIKLLLTNKQSQRAPRIPTRQHNRSESLPAGEEEVRCDRYIREGGVKLKPEIEKDCHQDWGGQGEIQLTAWDYESHVWSLADFCRYREGRETKRLFW